MKVLVIGAGGREHAIVWALSRSPRVSELVCAPGNAGIAQVARCIPVDQKDAAAIAQLALAEKPGLVIIGPEVPLAAGAVDALQSAGIRTFGPTQAAARLESSKSFAKEFMQRHNIPTARYTVCTSLDTVHAALAEFNAPLVVKADGLAAGKGVVICETKEQAQQAAEDIFSGTLLGSIETSIVLEEFLEGEEDSFFALCDGIHAVPLAAAQDHKRLLEPDLGPNTGGMGAYCTDSLLTAAQRQWMIDHVAQPVVDGMAAEGTPCEGILFCGFMMTARGPMVLEFNTRWGDPETQAIMLRLKSDALALFEAGVDGTADKLQLEWLPGASVCVIAASAAYPASSPGGERIDGLDTEKPNGVEVFHSGTASKDDNIVTNGGRILGITAAADNLRRALGKAYDALGNISFQGMQYRRDIGHHALAKEHRE